MTSAPPGPLERAVAAMVEASPAAGYGDTHLRSRGMSKEVCRDLLVVALRAIREPDEATLRKGTNASCDLEYLPHDDEPMFQVECRTGLYSPEVLTGWRAMIDHILAERTGGGDAGS